MNGIFTRQSWEERSLFFHTKRGNKQCKANSTVSERTEDVVVPRLYKSKNKQQFVKYFAVHFFSLRSKTYFERPARTGNQFPVLSVPNYAPNTILEFQRIENHFTNNEWNFKKTYSLIECFNGRILSNFRHKHETVGWTWGIRVGRDPADIVDAVAMKFEFLNRTSAVAVPYNRFL